jgi:uncharacterized protein YbaR (Trm112 family)
VPDQPRSAVAELSAQLDAECLELLRCPRCAGALQESQQQLVCGLCSETYPVVDGIPVLLSDLDAISAQMKEWYEANWGGGSVTPPPSTPTRT